MKKEIKFSISESLHTELQGIVEKKKIGENQIIEQIISDFITKQNVENDRNNVKSINYVEFIPLLVLKIQNQQKEIDELREQIKVKKEVI